MTEKTDRQDRDIHTSMCKNGGRGEGARRATIPAVVPVQAPVPISDFGFGFRFRFPIAVLNFGLRHRFRFRIMRQIRIRCPLGFHCRCQFRFQPRFSPVHAFCVQQRKGERHFFFQVRTPALRKFWKVSSPRSPVTEITVTHRKRRSAQNDAPRSGREKTKQGRKKRYKRI